jgi:transcriptional repressor NrdR
LLDFEASVVQSARRDRASAHRSQNARALWVVMKCPFCGSVENKVIDSRLSQGDEVTRRRRECERCTRRFTTYERIELVLPMVVKKDGRRETFDRLKVLAGLRRACEKRPVASDRLEQLVDQIERDCVESGDKEIAAARIGEEVMNRLKELDQVAYVRFASVYRSFKDIHEFMAELSQLLTQSNKADSD